MTEAARQQRIGFDETETGHRDGDFQLTPLPPIKGYPELRWNGKRPFTSIPYYPAQHKETHGIAVEDWRNKIYWGDNFQVMSHLLKDYRGEIGLIYIDPPFDSKADYKKKIELHSSTITNDRGAFEEKQYTDIWTNDQYLQFMYERLILLKELLHERGSFFLHCDWHKGHLLRCLADEIFGPDNLRNEIAWCYGGGGAPKSHYPHKHDTLLWYTRSSEWIFHKQYRPYSEGTLERGLTAVKGDYELSDDGAMLNDWWAEQEVQKILSPTAYENLKYPTQKPEGLLKRIIRGHTNPGDIVLDCFMGSGTTQAVAMKLGRRFIGADINLGAVQITTKRLLTIASQLSTNKQRKLISGDADKQASTLYTGFEVFNVNNYDIFRNPVEAKDILLQALEVNQLQAGHLFDGEKDGRMIKIMPVNRIATRQDLNELINGIDYRKFEQLQTEHPNQPVEKITLVCMGHEPDLAAMLQREVRYKIDVEVVDILRDKQDLQFKRDSEAKITIQDGFLIIEKFYPMNLLSKLSLQAESVEDWREMVESVMIDWNYDGAILQPSVTDIPNKNELVTGRYQIPADAGTIRVKITDLLSESLEQEVQYG